MSAGLALAFPGSRTLATWGRLLAPLQPEFLRIGYLLLHHVEVLTRLHRSHRPADFPLLILRALALEKPQTGSNSVTTAQGEDQLRRLDGRLGLGRPLLLRLLQTLGREGLVQGDVQAGWSLSAGGSAALDHGEAVREVLERRAFYFLEPEVADGTERRPVFLPLRSQEGWPCSVAEDWSFDLNVLRACLERPAEWKRRWGFPLEVAGVVLDDRSAELAGLPAWQGVPLDRAEQLPVVLAAVADAGGLRLLGFVFQLDGWTLEVEEPVLTLEPGWEEELGWLQQGPGPEVWRAAWRQWCRQRALPADEEDTTGLEQAGLVVRVQPGPHLRERLVVTRSDALKGEAWLLAGQGRLRAAARVEIVSGG
jgi:hypothetical protein